MVVGIDMGSRTIKVAVLNRNKFTDFRVEESGFDPRSQALRMLKDIGVAKDAEIVATGYGRNLAKEHFARQVITEIKAHALGARHLFPSCHCVLDVGGQDAKVIVLSQTGKVVDFQMNDKCAAGTGRFLEIMAASLGFSLEEFGGAALSGRESLRINSMCTVFAESEVISLKNHGRNTRDIALAVHQSIVDRLLAMLHRAGGPGAELVFSGGVAKNICIVKLIEKKLGISVKLPKRPELTGAIGAALYGKDAGAVTTPGM